MDPSKIPLTAAEQAARAAELAELAERERVAQLARDQEIRVAAVSAAARITAATLHMNSQYAPTDPTDALLTLADRLAAWIAEGGDAGRRVR